jgi:hypothetical protein
MKKTFILVTIIAVILVVGIVAAMKFNDAIAQEVAQSGSNITGSRFGPPTLDTPTSSNTLANIGHALSKLFPTDNSTNLSNITRLHLSH